MPSSRPAGTGGILLLKCPETKLPASPQRGWVGRAKSASDWLGWIGGARLARRALPVTDRSLSSHAENGHDPSPFARDSGAGRRGRAAFEWAAIDRPAAEWLAVRVAGQALPVAGWKVTEWDAKSGSQPRGMPPGSSACPPVAKIPAPRIPGTYPDAFCDAKADQRAPGRGALPHRRCHFLRRRSGDSGSRMGHYDGHERTVAPPGGRPAVHQSARGRRDRFVAAGHYTGRHAAAPAGPARPPTRRPAGLRLLAGRRIAATDANSTAHAAAHGATPMANLATALAVSLTVAPSKPVGRLAVGRLASPPGQSVSLGLGRQQALVATTAGHHRHAPMPGTRVRGRAS
jgi:hypothetical protein